MERTYEEVDYDISMGMGLVEIFEGCSDDFIGTYLMGFVKYCEKEYGEDLMECKFYEYDDVVFLQKYNCNKLIGCDY